MANDPLTIYQSVNSLVDKPPPKEKLKPAETPDAIRAKTGLEPKRAGSGAGSGNEVTVKSTDGLFTFTVRVVNT